MKEYRQLTRADQPGMQYPSDHPNAHLLASLHEKIQRLETRIADHLAAGLAADHRHLAGFTRQLHLLRTRFDQLLHHHKNDD